MLSIIHLAELLGLYTRERLFFEAFPIDKYKCVIRFADQEDATLTKFLFDKSFQDFIFLWYGNLGNIPDDWVLCNGTKGTPDLRDNFVIGAGLTYAVNATGGSTTHQHTATTDGHFHNTKPGSDIDRGIDHRDYSDFKTDTLTTDLALFLPPYHALAFIQNKGWVF